MKKTAALFGSFILLLIVLIVFSLCAGRFGFINLFALTEQTKTILLNIRLPRVITACVVGASLSAAGVCFQTLFHNPLASPDILGASSGAGFGAALAILFGLSKVLVTGAAFLMSLLSIIFVYVISFRAHGKRTFVLIVAGILVSALFSSATSFVKLVADPTNKLPEITYWLMGSLNGKKTEDFIFITVCFVCGFVPLFLLRWKINLLSLSTDEAKSLGMNTRLLKTVVIICATLLTSASVAVSGLIGWIGIIIPQISRRTAGENCTTLLPFSAVLGAAFLLTVDTISRCAFSTEIPIGVLMTFVGTPFFIVLLLRRKSI